MESVTVVGGRDQPPPPMSFVRPPLRPLLEASSLPAHTKRRGKGSPYAGKLIAEKQGFLRSVSENCGELRDEEEVLECESGDSDVAAKFGEVVLVGVADLLDDAVQAEAFEKARDL